jgi:hypothetical protein
LEASHAQISGAQILLEIFLLEFWQGFYLLYLPIEESIYSFASTYHEEKQTGKTGYGKT